MTSTESNADFEAAEPPETAEAVAERLHRHVLALDGLHEATLVEHVEFYQQAYTELQDALTGIDDA